LAGERRNPLPIIPVDGTDTPMVDDVNHAIKVRVVVNDVATGGTSAADDADFVAGTTSGTPAMGVYESSPTSVTDNDMGIVGITQTRALRVNVDNSGDIGGGTQYTEGATDATITGTALMWEDGADTLVVASAAKPLPVEASIDTTGLALETKQDTQITHLAAIEAAVEGTVAVSNAGLTELAGAINASAQVDVNVAANGIGLATSAKQDTIIGHVDGIETALTAANASLDAIEASVAAIDTDTSALLTTAAHDAAFGTAGTADAQVRSIQGIASMTPVQVSQATAATLNMTEASAASILTAVQLIDDTVYVDDTATHATGTSKGIGIMAAATPTDAAVSANDIGMLAMSLSRALHVILQANSGVDIGDVDVTSIAAGTNLVGDVGIQPRTTNGLDTFMASGSDGSSILVATAQVIKASAGKLYGYYAFNPEASTTFVHFYNTAAASVTVGTTNPLFTLAIPAGAAANLMSEIGITFSNAGWSCAATTTAGGNTAPSTGVSLVAWYK
jgi:hypothetical protein